MATGNWISKALGKTQAIEDLSSVNHEMAMLLILGRNTFGDEIYTYMKLPMQRIDEVKTRISSGQAFVPAHYGSVVAAGRGVPSPDIREEVGTPDFMLYFKPKAEPKQFFPQTSQKGGY
jgi:hypothetical protein